VRDNNFKVVLTGEGADEFFAGIIFSRKTGSGGSGQNALNQR
jgi:asparagine synthetase B (glutamine-hydrolysing)